MRHSSGHVVDTTGLRKIGEVSTAIEERKKGNEDAPLVNQRQLIMLKIPSTSHDGAQIGKTVVKFARRSLCAPNCAVLGVHAKLVV
jgi:hypothetical protein